MSVLTNALATSTGLTRSVVDQVLSALNAEILVQLADGRPVKLGVGTFKRVERAARAARKGRNPQTGEALEIEAKPAKSVIVFKQSGKITL
jgi:DNA-binding protein HU-beta